MAMTDNEVFALRYTKTLTNLIERMKAERDITNDCMQVMMSELTPETALKIFNASCSMPEHPQTNTYQATAFIGYLRGCWDILDVMSKITKINLDEVTDNE